MAYTTIDKPSDYFSTKLWSGNATDDRAISGLDFAPNWVWIKNRTDSNSHAIFDTIRTATKYIESDTNDAEATGATFLKSFTSDGFTLGTAGRVNSSGNNYVSWNWKAGGSASSNSDGSITSSVSANTTAGFSIVSWTNSGSSNETIGHGLGVAPKMIIIKSRSKALNWLVYYESVGNTKSLSLNTTTAEDDNVEIFNDTSPTSTVFTTGVTGSLTGGSQLIAYCFNDVKGYSKISSYVGNGSTDGTFVYTGFKPAFFMCKGNADINWQIFDNKRSNQGGFNINDEVLAPNTNGAEYDEGSSSWGVDFLSNGFKPRGGWAGFNTSGRIYHYIAFAESPFVTSTGIPTTAR